MLCAFGLERMNFRREKTKRKPHIILSGGLSDKPNHQVMTFSSITWRSCNWEFPNKNWRKNRLKRSFGMLAKVFVFDSALCVQTSLLIWNLYLSYLMVLFHFFPCVFSLSVNRNDVNAIEIIYKSKAHWRHTWQTHNTVSAHTRTEKNEL